MSYQKLFKYLIMFIIVVLSINYVPQNDNYAFMIGFIVSISFAILDIYSPSIIIEKHDN